jgi:membrane protein DedA with SNARE-associated domain
VDAFFERHGGKAILIGRFVGLVRAVAPFVAGASGLALRRFVPFSLAGTFVWATAFTLAGYAFHESFESAAGALTHGALALAVLAAIAVAVKTLRTRRAA